MAKINGYETRMCPQCGIGTYEEPKPPECPYCGHFFGRQPKDKGEDMAKIVMCDFCEEEHAELRVTKVIGFIRGEEVEYENIATYCPVEDMEFQCGEQLNKTLDNMRQAYFNKTGIEIKKKKDRA